MLTLYVATTNAGKLRDFATATSLQPRVRTEPVPGLSAMPEPVEDAPTFTGNADLKAIAYSLYAPGLLVLADDAGLEVDALGGRPGVFSARFAETLNFAPELHSPKDERNNSCVLALLQDLEQASGGQLSRAARFVCALSVARDGHVLRRAEGTVAGELLHTPRGANGFGYDSLFLVRSRGLTLAELSPEDKWSISHRGQAFRELLRQFTS